MMQSGSDLLAQVKASQNRPAFLATLKRSQLRRIVRLLNLCESNGSRFYRMDENRERILEALGKEPPQDEGVGGAEAAPAPEKEANE